MCGLLGYSGSKPFNKDFVRLLFYANESRGKDSSGFYNENLDLEFKERVKKELGSPITNMIAKHKIFNNVKPSNLFIGHTRHATVGDKSITNAHPFIYDNVVGVHNGTLRNLNTLISKYNLAFPDANFTHNQITVDSKIFYHYINNAEYGNLDVIKDFDGAAALMWRDLRDNGEIINIWRNSERPLHYVCVEEGEDSFMYISSEKDPLIALGLGDVKEFFINRHYKIFKGKIISDVTLINSPVKNPYVKSHQMSINTTDDLLINDILYYLNNVLLAKDSKRLHYVKSYPLTYTHPSSVATIELDGKKFTKIVKNGLIEVFSNQTLSSRKKTVISAFYNKSSNEFIITYKYDDGSFYERELAVDEKFMEEFFSEVRKKGKDSVYKHTYCSVLKAESKTTNKELNDEVVPWSHIMGSGFLDPTFMEILENEDPFGPEEDEDDNIEESYYTLPVDDLNEFISDIGNRINGNLEQIVKISKRYDFDDNYHTDIEIAAITEDMKGMIEDLALFKEALITEEVSK